MYISGAAFFALLWVVIKCAQVVVGAIHYNILTSVGKILAAHGANLKTRDITETPHLCKWEFYSVKMNVHIPFTIHGWLKVSSTSVHKI